MVTLEPTAPRAAPAAVGPAHVVVPTRRTWLQIVVVSVVGSLVSILPIVYAHRASPRTLVSAHGLLHTAIAERFQSPSAVAGRPENPFFAGEPLPYYWFFHYLAARISVVAGIHPLYAFEFMILVAMSVLWFAAVPLGYRLYGGLIPGLAIGFLALAGANPFGAMILLVKVVARGASVLADGPDYLWGIAHPIMGVARYNDPYAYYGPLINFFFNISSRPIALSLLPVICLSLLAWLQSRSLAAWLGMTLSSAACAAFSFLIGVSAAVAMIGGLAVVRGLCALGRLGEAPTGNRGTRDAVAAAAALLLGLVLALPTYYYFFLGAENQSIHLGGRLWSVEGSALSASVVAVMAVRGVLRAKGVRQQFLLATTSAAYALFIASTVIELPVFNECNLFQAAVFLLSIPAAGCLAPGVAWSRARTLLAWGLMLLVFLPTTCIVAYAYLNRAAIAVEIAGGRLYRLPRESPLAHLYEWVRDQTAPDAIFILDPMHPIAAGGNMPEFPAMTGRVMFTAGPKNYMVSADAAAPFRVGLALHLLAGQVANEHETAYLDSLQRPVYLVGGFSGAAVQSLESRYGPPVFRDGDLAVLRIR
jgi:hypothetical protein